MTKTKRDGDGRKGDREEEVLSTYCVPGQCQAFLSRSGRWEPSQPPSSLVLSSPFSRPGN